MASEPTNQTVCDRSRARACAGRSSQPGRAGIKAPGRPRGGLIRTSCARTSQPVCDRLTLGCALVGRRWWWACSSSPRSAPKEGRTLSALPGRRHASLRRRARERAAASARPPPSRGSRCADRLLARRVSARPRRGVRALAPRRRSSDPRGRHRSARAGWERRRPRARVRRRRIVRRSPRRQGHPSIPASTSSGTSSQDHLPQARRSSFVKARRVVASLGSFRGAARRSCDPPEIPAPLRPMPAAAYGLRRWASSDSPPSRPSAPSVWRRRATSKPRTASRTAPT